MKPDAASRRLLGITRSKAKMFEYDVPIEDHIRIVRDPGNLFPISIGLLGDLASQINSDTDYPENGQTSNLGFSAQFFDNYLQSHLRDDLDPYLVLLGSSSYYLADLPGSSKVLAKRLEAGSVDLGCLGLEDLLHWLLRGDFVTPLQGFQEPFGESIQAISSTLVEYFATGGGRDELFQQTSQLRKIAYEIATPRQLLFADASSAIARKRVENSTWFLLPQYSRLTVEEWRPALTKQTFIKELWPAQRRLGERGVFEGKSAVVQMPTSAGKTKAIEIIVRSAFLSGRTSVALVVAPYRALCHEIRNDLVTVFKDENVSVNELTDVFQPDFDFVNARKTLQVFVVTPEKLVFVLRYNPKLAPQIGLLVYDEGHQFDNGYRGVTYELLVTSLKKTLAKDTQTILISAVITNPDAVSAWLNGVDSTVVPGNDLNPTYRTLAFSSWASPLGRLQFVDQTAPDNEEFYVPRVIEQQVLGQKRINGPTKVFPERDNGSDIALYLGLKVVPRGSAAIFVGTKLTAVSICGRAVDIFDRGLSLKKPVEYSDQSEIKRLDLLHERNLGSDAITTKSAALGIFAHHNNVPHGIRLAVEFALKKDLAKFVICTSTLAQGVNLPLRYLIMSTMFQAGERLKVRDFHNLIGRADRSGMFTEGSILFANPKIYDFRIVDSWRWEMAKELLDPTKSEACTSELASVLEPIVFPQDISITIQALDLVRAYVETTIPQLVQSKVPTSLQDSSDFIEFTGDISEKVNIFSAIESYLMTFWKGETDEGQEADITQLASETLAYYLAEDDEKEQLVEVFRILSKNIADKIPEAIRQKAFARTFLGVESALIVEDWVRNHGKGLLEADSQEALLDILWERIFKDTQNSTLRKCDPPEHLRELIQKWVAGESFANLFQFLESKDVRTRNRTQRRHLKVESVVDICENAFGYEAMLIVGAVAEIIQVVHAEGAQNVVRNIQGLQKRLRYGLPTLQAIALYELGFADRVIALELSETLQVDFADRETVIAEIKLKEQNVKSILENYPSYFTHVLEEVLEN